MPDTIGRMTLLIVDDHAAFRTYARSMLDAEGFDVVGDVADGESAVAAVETLGPDAVLLDIQLGSGIDGFEVARRLAALPHPPRVVLASSREASTFGSRLTEAPVRGFVSKEELSGQALAALLGDA
ncbi:response regulator [Aeromicrobium sp.]|uniref:response regulator n=1 Tax=Aeromicrobium sp. TaxID=1871063 RepID=UPI003C69EF27